MIAPMDSPVLTSGPWAGFSVVSQYTRARAIADGVLVDAHVGDLREVTVEHVGALPVVMTAGLFAFLARAVAHPTALNDWSGVWHDVLWMSGVRVIAKHAAQLLDRDGGVPRRFRVIITGTGRTHTHTLQVVVAPDDHGMPSLVFGLDDDDLS